MKVTFRTAMVDRTNWIESTQLGFSEIGNSGVFHHRISQLRVQGWAEFVEPPIGHQVLNSLAYQTY